jgi:hypothetical protein
MLAAGEADQRPRKGATTMTSGSAITALPSRASQIARPQLATIPRASRSFIRRRMIPLPGPGKAGLARAGQPCVPPPIRASSFLKSTGFVT